MAQVDEIARKLDDIPIPPSDGEETSDEENSDEEAGDEAGSEEASNEETGNEEASDEESGGEQASDEETDEEENGDEEVGDEKDDTDEGASESAGEEEQVDPTQEKSGERRMPEPDIEGPSDPDVMLDAPEVSVDEIDLKVDDLDARLALQAKVADLVEIQAGVDVHLGAVELNINGVMAEVHLQVDLDNVAEIIKETFQALAENPEIVQELGKTARSAADDVSDTAEEALGEEGAVGELAGSAGEAVEDVGEGAGAAAEDVGEGAGAAVEDVGEGAGEAAEDVGEGAAEAAGDVGQVTGEAAEGVGGATETAGKAAGEAGGDVAQGVAEEAGAEDAPLASGTPLEGVLDENGTIAEGALGDALDLAVDAEVIERNGSWYAFEGETIGQGREAVVAQLREDGAACQRLSERLRQEHSDADADPLISERTDEDGRTVRRVRDPSGAVTFEYVVEDGDVKGLEVVEGE